MCFLIAHYPLIFKLFLIFGVSKRKKCGAFFELRKQKFGRNCVSFFFHFFCWRAKFFKLQSFLKMRKKKCCILYQNATFFEINGIKPVGAVRLRWYSLGVYYDTPPRWSLVIGQNRGEPLGE